jgi:hypothetical protein
MRVPMINLGRLLLLASALVLVAWGCQGPDAFYRGEDGGDLHELGGHTGGEGGKQGEGGAGTGGIVVMGSGGSTMGTGGSITGTGGKITGTGGSTTGTGGSTTGTGGKITGTGGKATGTGGKIAGTGGMVTGSGGMAAGTGGKVTGTGGKAAGTGGATTGTDAGVITPCTGLCDPSITTQFMVSSMAAYVNNGVGVATEVCYYTKNSPSHIGCSNLNVSGMTPPRTMTVNGTDETTACTAGAATLPAAQNGGYCFAVSAGEPTYAGFTVYY